jgi:hypothetical protein
MTDSSTKKRPIQYQLFDPIAKQICDAAINTLTNVYLKLLTTQTPYPPSLTKVVVSPKQDRF